MKINATVHLTNGSTVASSSVSQESSALNMSQSNRFECEFECYLCKQTFANADSLSMHLKNHPSDLFPHIRKHLNTNRNLKTHNLTQNSEKRYAFTYQQCHKKYLSNSELITHIRSHTGERPFDCTLSKL